MEKFIRELHRLTNYVNIRNRISEQDLGILMLSNDVDALDYFYRSHSSSIMGRRSDILFREDSKDGFIIDIPKEDSVVVDMFNAYFKAMGLKLDIEYNETDSDSQESIEMDDIEVPSYIKKLF